LNPYVTALVLSSGILVLCLPKKWALVPFVLVAPIIPPGQFLEIGAFHFYVSRLMLLFLWIRVLARREYKGTETNKIDKLMMAQFFFGMVAYVALRGGSSTALVNRLGWVFDGISIYFLMRWMIRDYQTWIRVIAAFAIICAVIAVPMVQEYRSHVNPFHVLGGVDQTGEIRDGKYRSQGPFGHSILAGVFAANLVPLFISLGWIPKPKGMIRLIGLLAAVVIVITSSSSTPFMSMVIGIVSLVLWRMRTKMKLLRRGMVLALVVCQLFMSNPIWAIVAKFKVFGGSTGYYRFYLIDNYIRRFSEWWLLGIKSTAVWGRGLWDVTVTYVRVGVDGGFLGLVLFMSIIVMCYKQIGRLVKSLPEGANEAKCVWALGAALTAHLAAFFGVNYWDQNVVPWYMLLAVIAGSSEIFAVEGTPIPEQPDEFDPNSYDAFDNKVGAREPQPSLGTLY
jgi:hypothetical protein